MNKLWILDTDHLSLFQQGHPEVTQRIKRKNPENLAVTVITLEEKLRGRLKNINEYNNKPLKSDKLIAAYKRLADEIEFFKNIRILDFDNRAFENYELLIMKERVTIGTQDLRIAAIAESVDGILVTRNQDFEKAYLLLEDWTVKLPT
ncbi:MAG: type II toxin-antitoxin system VapC family toxin [Nostoc sp.]|uniref:type II toxin-antitoxin system VapC family toxin n=1 Tax=Nostoc sp. TaxID=1180 RepID=UPI002FF873BA